MRLYRQICEEFGFDPEEDARSALELSNILAGRSEPSLAAVSRRMPGRVTVCGASETLPHEISGIDVRGYTVAADGATSDLMFAGTVPNMIVTDLDGAIDDQVEANRLGAAVFVHAHGDLSLIHI